jgi:hypothetical protein
MKLPVIISVGFDVTDQIFCIHQILEKKLKYNETVHQLFIDLVGGGIDGVNTSPTLIKLNV